MSESINDLILTPRTRLLNEQKARFAEAWESAVRQGEPPRIAAFLGSTKEPDRSRLIRDLQEIERTYLVRLSLGEANAIRNLGKFPIPDSASNHTGLVTGFSSEKRDITPTESARKITESDPNTSQVSDAPESPVDPDRSLATLRLPGNFPEPSIETERSNSSWSDFSSIHLPLLDSWGRDLEAPPIPGTSRSIMGPQPSLKGYEILGELGRGGMGVVYKANQQGLNRLVAIKMVLGGDHAREEDLARFRIEAESVASIQHPNIVQIYEVGDQNGIPYFSLEFIDGGTLHQRIDGKPMPPERAAEIAFPLALAIGHFHERGVIHRDLKPANVLMTNQGTPKITDFGLAKRLEGNSSQTRTGSLMGTPSYMAPEQASGDTHAISPLSDLYSLGAVLYEMLTGRPPFQGATMLDTLDQVRSQEPVPPRRLQPKIPRDLETICLKCLQKEPQKRYPSASELSGDLSRFLVGEPIKARPIGRIEMGWRWARRNPRVAFLNLSIFVLAIFMVGLVVLATIRTAREARTIEDARVIANDRITRSKEAIAKGDFRNALEIVGFPDPFVEQTPRLVGVRDELRKFRAQLKTFAEFRKLLDRARNAGFLETDKKLAKAKNYFQELFLLYDEIESHTGRGEFGLPILNEWQLQLFKEDVFDTFLVAAMVEYDHEATKKDPEIQKAAAGLAVKWLNRAEKLLPPTRALYSRRQAFKRLIGDDQGAEADKKLAESIEPNSPVDLFWRGYSDWNRANVAVENQKIADARKFYGLARDEYARNLQARPEHFWGYLEWANCHLRLGNASDAIVGYTACIQLNPEAPWPYHNRATAHAEVNEHDAAVLDETEAIRRDPDFVAAFLGRSAALEKLGKNDEALSDLNLAIKLDPANKELIFRRGTFFFGRKKFDKALNDFNSSVQSFPKMAGPYQSRAKTRLVLHDFEGSLSDWSVFITFYPRDYESRYYIGVINMGLRRYDEALEALDECLAFNPGFPPALLARARIEHWIGEDQEALKDLDALVKRIETSKWDKSTRASYLNERVELYRLLGRLDDSSRDAFRSIEIEPKQVDAYLGLALIETKRGKPLTEVLTWYDLMLQANPDSSEVHLRRAEYFREIGQWDQARSESDQAASLEDQKNRNLARLIKASLIAAQGDYQAAIAQAEAIFGEVSVPDGPSLYAASCVWSLSSRAAAKVGDESNHRVLADRAADFLRRSLSEGFHELDYQQMERMRIDPAIEPIRDRADVRKLLSFQP